ncbi:hypothetical protein T439DRAFT_360723 [Meredithblackwellia eburnea MCA 4105]
MHFSTLSLVGVLSLIAISSAAPHDKRADQAQVISAFNDLTSKLKSAGSALSSAISFADTSDPVAFTAAVSPILSTMDSDLKSVASSLSLSKRDLLLFRRQEQNLTENAQAVAAAVQALIEALGPLEDILKNFPILGTLLAPFLSNLDIDLGIVLTGLGILLAGVLKLVSDLLSDLGSALSGLGFSSTLGILGL